MKLGFKNKNWWEAGERVELFQNTEEKQKQLPEHLFRRDQVEWTALQSVPETDHFRMDPSGQNHDERGRPHKEVNTDRPGPGSEAQQAKRMNEGQVSGVNK